MMPDESDEGIRRVGRKDRKKRIDTRKPLFPEDDDLRPPESEAEPELETEEPEELPPVEPEPARRNVTPPEERFPPLAPESEEPETPHSSAPRRRRPSWAYNLIAVGFLLATIAAIAYFALLWTNPYHPLNPLPPYTPLPIVVSATPLPPTSTPLPTATEPPTLAPTETVPAEVEATVVPQAASFAYSLDELQTTYAESASGCDWSGIAGQVINARGDGVEGLSVHVMSEDGEVLGTATTSDGSAFGPGGFEVRVSDTAQLTPYTIQLFSANGSPLSEEYLVVTSDQCDQNVVVVSFVAN